MTNHLFRSTRVMRTLLTLVMALLVVGLLLVSGPTEAAHAASTSLTCPTGSSDATYNPGIVFLTPRTTHVTANEDVGTCTGTGDAAGINSGDFSVSGPFSLSCDQLFTSTVPVTWTWNNGTRSTMSLTTVATIVDSTV